MIRVIKGTIKADGEKFTPGDIIEILSKKEEASLIASKVAEPWGIQAPPVEADIDDTDAEDTDAEVDETSKGESGTEESTTTDQEQSDSISIKFDAAAYVDGPDDKPKTRRK